MLGSLGSRNAGALAFHGGDEPEVLYWTGPLTEQQRLAVKSILRQVEDVYGLNYSASGQKWTLKNSG